MGSRPSAARALTTMLACSFALLLLAGCGNSRRSTPNIAATIVPRMSPRVRYALAGVSFNSPAGWYRRTERRTLVATLNSGPAVVALWRYPSSLPPPTGRPALGAARRRLIAAARKRDPTLAVIRSKLTTIDGAPTIVLNATESISRARRRVRSLHIFVSGAEIVLDEYAPPSLFRDVDRDVFSPLNHSLRLFSPPASRA